MNKGEVMKRWVACSVMWVFLALCGFAQATVMPQPALFPYGGRDVSLPEVNADVVVRQRLVTWNENLRWLQPDDLFSLPLFDDVTVSARVKSISSDPLGNVLVFIGGSESFEPEGVLAVGSESLAGSVRVSEKLFHIRPVTESVHVVRELAGVAASAPASSTQMTPLYFEWQTAALVNMERRINKLYDLAWDDLLFVAARAHSDDMATYDYFSHTSLDGRTPAERITAAGYAWNACGENIAAGYATPEAAMQAWMNSSGHRANILSTTFCDLGVGYAYVPESSYQHYWTQDFGRKMGVSVCPPVVNPPYPGTDGLNDIGWVASFYVAYWGRCPDPEGRSYWLNMIQTGALTAIGVAENFALSSEAKALYAYFQDPSAATDEDRRAFVREVYLHLLNREPDAEGLNYWATALATGEASPGQVIGHIINAAMTGHGTDWAVIRNKVDVGQYFADRVAQKGLVWTETLRGYAIAVLMDVTADTATVSQAMAQVDALLGGRP